MNFFELELRKIVSPNHPDATYVGRACYVPLGNGAKAKVQFFADRIADNYEALKMTVLNPGEGQVDSLLLRFSDLFGKKQVVNPNFRDGIVPHIWVDGLNAQWYVYQPTAADYASMQDAVNNYLNVFQTPGMEVQAQGQRETSAPEFQQTMSM